MYLPNQKLLSDIIHLTFNGIETNVRYDKKKRVK